MFFSSVRFLKHARLLRFEAECRDGCASRPERLNIPTEICKLLVDSLESHVPCGVCCVMCVA